MSAEFSVEPKLLNLENYYDKKTIDLMERQSSSDRWQGCYRIGCIAAVIGIPISCAVIDNLMRIGTDNQGLLDAIIDHIQNIP